MKRYMNRPRPIISSWDKLPLLMTTGETSALLDIPEESVRRKCREGKLPAVRIGALYRIDRDALKAMLTGGDRI